MRTLIIISAVAKQYSPASAFLYGIYNVSTNTNVSETACARHFVFPCPEKQNVLRQSRSPKPPRSGPDGGLASSGVRKAFCFSVSGKTKCSAPITLTQAPAKRFRGGLASSGVRKAFWFSVSGKTKCSAPNTLTQAPAKRFRGGLAPAAKRSGVQGHCPWSAGFAEVGYAQARRGLILTPLAQAGDDQYHQGNQIGQRLENLLRAAIQPRNV